LETNFINTINWFYVESWEFMVLQDQRCQKGGPKSINSIMTLETKDFQDNSMILWVKNLFYIAFLDIHRVAMKKFAWFEFGPYAHLWIKLLSFDKTIFKWVLDLHSFQLMFFNHAFDIYIARG